MRLEKLEYLVGPHHHWAFQWTILSWTSSLLGHFIPDIIEVLQFFSVEYCHHFYFVNS